MRRLPKFPHFCVILIIGLLACGQAQAQASRTWVSGVGDDANPCSRTAPCKTFPGAISKTAAGGVIDVLDPGGFGAVTITKSITLENVGEVGSILVAGTNGIVVNAPGAIVTLRGLSLEGFGATGASLAGVTFIQGSELIVERCDIGNFTGGSGMGIKFAPNSAATLNVRDTTIHGNGNTNSPTTTGGILIAPATGGSVNATLDNVRILNSNGFGLMVQGPAAVVVRNSVASTNSGDGFAASSNSAAASLTLDHVVASGNSASGVAAQGSAALIRVSDSTISSNTQGIRAVSGGAVVSFGNNRNLGNIVNGAPTAASPLQ